MLLDVVLAGPSDRIKQPEKQDEDKPPGNFFTQAFPADIFVTCDRR
jgi:hypothetical protein